MTNTDLPHVQEKPRRPKSLHSRLGIHLPVWASKRAGLDALPSMTGKVPVYMAGMLSGVLDGMLDSIEGNLASEGKKHKRTVIRSSDVCAAIESRSDDFGDMDDARFIVMRSKAGSFLPRQLMSKYMQQKSGLAAVATKGGVRTKTNRKTRKDKKQKGKKSAPSLRVKKTKGRTRKTKKRSKNKST